MYNAINTVLSALSAYLGVTYTMYIDQSGAHPLIVRFIKMISRSRPTLPRHHCIWNMKDMF